MGESELWINYCRGCLKELLEGHETHSLESPETKFLFETCTSLSIPPDDLRSPQRICSDCYNQCKQWISFRSTCHEIDKFIRFQSLPEESSKTPLDQEMEIEFDFEAHDSSEEDDGELSEFLEMQDIEIIADFQNHDPPKDDLEELSNAGAAESNEEADCPVCLISLRSTMPLRDHLRTHVSDENPRCPICDQYFTRSSKIYLHILTAHPKAMDRDQKDRISISCTKISPEMDEERSIHKSVCPFCLESFGSLSLHITSAHIKKGDTQCPICALVVSDSWTLSSHLLTHTYEKPYECSSCDEKFTGMVKLKSHTAQRHPKDLQKFNDQIAEVCNECERYFRNPIELETHVRLHKMNGSICTRQEKRRASKWNCKICTGTFPTSNVFARHMASVHPGGRLGFPCPTCKKSFARLDVLKTHKLQHTTQYCCATCSFRARKIDSLMKHELKCGQE